MGIVNADDHLFAIYNKVPNLSRLFLVLILKGIFFTCFNVGFVTGKKNT